MRLTMAAIISIAALGGGVAATEPDAVPFNGAWMLCDVWRGAEICEYRMLAQRGNRVCGVQRYFAASAYHEERFAGTAKANIVNLEKVCGDPGPENIPYCRGRAPTKTAKTGWQATNRTLGLCDGRLYGGRTRLHPCTGMGRRLGMPRVDNPGDRGPRAEDRAWLASCVRGAE